MTDNPFKAATFAALRKSYGECQVLKLSFDQNVTKMTEYFITVNLCKALLKWNEKDGYNYKIEAEKNTQTLYKNCFENYKQLREDIWSPTIFASQSKEYSQNYDAIRSGKVDIALSRICNSENISEYIFEAKAINPDMGELKKDFQRIQQFLAAEIPNFENSLKSGFIVFIMHHNNLNKIQKKESLMESQSACIDRLEVEFAEFKNPGIGFKVQTEDINLSAAESRNITDGFDYGEEAYSTFYAYGVIIEIQKLKQLEKSIISSSVSEH
ncbi:hypothetical protein [Flavobacterium sp. 140616W15]|uniref:hypothetical protein n=1 Tax=Flavobacterium sp. 140616W15 TaxID=2478552 RepID=UPI000F0C114E|nr:hypothetical protein [Flavobacterium sp. 140616W15]AYN03605.1 hypothetical protein EAG11_05040 [Flavobacterium sp. 140616W15]